MKLIKILSDRIQIKTDRFEFVNTRLNDLFLVSDEEVSLVTTVISIADNDTAGCIGEEDYIFENDSVKVIECSIIGSVRNGMFSKAIDKYPTTNIKCREITADEFAGMLHGYEGNGFCIGNYKAYNCPAYVDGNKFFQRHACIVGNTGSGKSETVTKILEETSKLKGANVIVFDVHGEYRKLSYVRNITIGRDFPFPIWMFGFSDMVTNILKIREETASVVMSALRKCYYTICKNPKENKPVYFDFDVMLEMMKQLNEEQIMTGEIYKTGEKAGTPKMAKGDYYGKLSGVINTMTDKRLDSRYEFLFASSLQSYVIKVIKALMENDKPVKNIDLSDIPHDVAISIIGVITKLVYEVHRMFEPEELCPITLVCDEAHVYIPNNFQLSASEKRMVEVFEDIAKEGRKFGFSLFVASQRPSELNKTIMAQCANFIVSKLNNENDKSMIKGMLPDGNESVIDATTTFSPGEVLVIGDSVPIPLKIQVSLAKERPESRTIDFWDRWKQGTKVNLEQGIEDYMNL
ncbi:MAG: ATP-binding protein [Tyzzerella sp.]|nr:ATP-binding protein [Tyzzerella sp.]